MIKKEKHIQALLGITAVFIVILVSISGCTSNQNTNETITQLSGTWMGNVEMSMFGSGGNASVSQITFTSNTAELTMDSSQRSFTINYTYIVNGNTIVLKPKFGNRGGFPGQPPQNGTFPWNNTTRPPMNETWPNGTQPSNWSRPGNWTGPMNRTGNPGGTQPSMSITFTYSVNEDHTVLYLNGAEFRKI